MTTQSPPVSGETQKLLDIGQEVLQGAEDKLPELQALVASRHSAMSTGRAVFVEQVDARGPAFRAQFSQPIEAVEKVYQTYLENLDELQASTQELDKEELGRGLEAFKETVEEAQRVSNAYEQIVLTSGPSRFPEVNLVTNLVTALHEGAGSEAAFQETGRSYQKFYQAVFDELAAYKETLQPGIAERKAAAAAILKAWDNCLKLNGSSSADSVVEAVDELSRGQLDMETANRTFMSKAFAETPTGSKEANWIIHAAEGFMRKKYPAVFFRSFVVDMLYRTRKALPDLEAASRFPQEDAGLKAGIAEALAATVAVEANLTALDNEAQAEEPSMEQLDSTLHEFEQSIERLLKANAALKETEQNKGQVCCPHCQAYNKPNARSCQKCQRTLPQVASFGGGPSMEIMEGAEGRLGAPQGPVMTKSLKELFELVDAFERKTSTPADVLARLDHYDETLKKAEQALPEYQLPEIPENATPEEHEKAKEFVDLAAETQALVEHGTQLCRKGLDKLRAGVQGDDLGAVSEGLQSYFEGVQEMLKARFLGQTFDQVLGAEVKQYLDREAAKGSPKPAVSESEESAEESAEDDDGNGLV